MHAHIPTHVYNIIYRIAHRTFSKRCRVFRKVCSGIEIVFSDEFVTVIIYCWVSLWKTFVYLFWPRFEGNIYIVVAAGSSKSSGFCIRVEMYHKWARYIASERCHGDARWLRKLATEAPRRISVRKSWLMCMRDRYVAMSASTQWLPAYTADVAEIRGTCWRWPLFCTRPRNLRFFKHYLHSFERFSRPLLRGCKPPPSWLCRWGCCVRLANILG